jgi:hypothetical protein
LALKAVSGSALGAAPVLAAAGAAAPAATAGTLTAAGPGFTSLLCGRIDNGITSLLTAAGLWL